MQVFVFHALPDKKAVMRQSSANSIDLQTLPLA
jgi:hypothetical protein